MQVDARGTHERVKRTLKAVLVAGDEDKKKKQAAE